MEKGSEPEEVYENKTMQDTLRHTCVSAATTVYEQEILPFIRRRIIKNYFENTV